MQMRNQKECVKRLKKSQLLLIGSLLVFVGVFVLSHNYVSNIKKEVFNDMRLAVDKLVEDSEPGEVIDIPSVDNLTDNNTSETVEQEVDYSQYLGVLEIPKIGLKRGFYNIDSKYNDIQYNVSVVKGSTMPDVAKGNLILMAHSGDAYISYFAYLYMLKIGDLAYVTYNGNKYTYKLVNVYNVEKNGRVKIVRSYDHTTLTLVTCTKNDDTLQTVYILELV